MRAPGRLAATLVRARPILGGVSECPERRRARGEWAAPPPPPLAVAAVATGAFGRAPLAKALGPLEEAEPGALVARDGLAESVGD